MAARAKKTAAPEAASDPKSAPEMALVLRTSDKNRRSYNATFQWPESGPVSCADWKPTVECGHGLHGLLDGLGDYSHLTFGQGETVQVVEVERGACIDLSGKVKFPLCEIKFSGSWAGAWKLMIPALQKAIAKDVKATSGDNAPAATSGNYAPAATSGDNAPAATSGYNAPAATSGNYAPAATSGDNAPAATSGYKAPAATSGDNAPAATSGDNAPAATSGNYAPAATSGDNAPAATSGDNAPAATSGYKAPAATSGNYAPACSAFGGTAKAAENGAIMLSAYGDWDGKHYPLLAVFAGMVGRVYDGITIMPGVAYELNADGKLIEAA